MSLERGESYRMSVAYTREQAQELLDLFPEAQHMKRKLRHNDLSSLFQDTMDHLAQIFGSGREVIHEFQERKARKRIDYEMAIARAARKQRVGVRFEDDEARALEYVESKALQRAGIKSKSRSSRSSTSSRDKVSALSRGLLSSAIEGSGNHYGRDEGRSQTSSLRSSHRGERRDQSIPSHYEQERSSTVSFGGIHRDEPRDQAIPSHYEQPQYHGESFSASRRASKRRAQKSPSPTYPNERQQVSEEIFRSGPRRVAYDVVGTSPRQATFEDLLSSHDRKFEMSSDESYYFLDSRAQKFHPQTQSKTKLTSSLSRAPKYQGQTPLMKQQHPIRMDPVPQLHLSPTMSTASNSSCQPTESNFDAWGQPMYGTSQTPMPFPSQMMLLRSASNSSFDKVELTSRTPNMLEDVFIDITSTTSSSSDEEDELILATMPAVVGKEFPTNERSAMMLVSPSVKEVPTINNQAPPPRPVSGQNQFLSKIREPSLVASPKPGANYDIPIAISSSSDARQLASPRQVAARKDGVPNSATSQSSKSPIIHEVDSSRSADESDAIRARATKSSTPETTLARQLESLGELKSSRHHQDPPHEVSVDPPQAALALNTAEDKSEEAKPESDEKSKDFTAPVKPPKDEESFSSAENSIETLIQTIQASAKISKEAGHSEPRSDPPASVRRTVKSRSKAKATRSSKERQNASPVTPARPNKQQQKLPIASHGTLSGVASFLKVDNPTPNPGRIGLKVDNPRPNPNRASPPSSSKPQPQPIHPRKKADPRASYSTNIDRGINEALRCARRNNDIRKAGSPKKLEVGMKSAKSSNDIRKAGSPKKREFLPILPMKPQPYHLTPDMQDARESSMGQSLSDASLRRAPSTGDDAPSHKQNWLKSKPTEVTNTTTGVVCSQVRRHGSDVQTASSNDSDVSSLSNPYYESKGGKTPQTSFPETKEEKRTFYRSRGNPRYISYEPAKNDGSGSRSVSSYSTWATDEQEFLLESVAAEAAYVRGGYKEHAPIKITGSESSESTAIEDIIARCQQKLHVPR